MPAFACPGLLREGSNRSKKIAESNVSSTAIPRKENRAITISTVQSTPGHLKIPVIVPGSPRTKPLV
jgi:hypothetical protein